MKTVITHRDGHDRFGGIIYLSDFDTNERGKDSFKGSIIANRIFSDWSFDKQCRENAKARDRMARMKEQDALENSN